MQKKRKDQVVSRCFSTRRSLLCAALALLLLLGGTVLALSPWRGDPHTRQQAVQNRANLDQTIQYALHVGVPRANLQTILDQAHALNATHAPLALLNDQPVTTYYHNLSVDYQILTVQTQGIIQVTTEEFAQQAQNDLQSLQRTLTVQQHAGLPLTTITQIYTQNQARMSAARYPRDYAVISKQIRDALAVVALMPDTLEKLQTLHQIIVLMHEGHQDVFELQKHYTDDQHAVTQATNPRDLHMINQVVDEQNQQAAAQFTKAIPLLTKAKVDELESNVQLLQQSGIATGEYQKRLDADRTRMQNVKTLQDYLTFSKQVYSDLAAMHTDLLKGQAITQLKQFHSEVNAWGDAHQYLDKYNGQSYPLDGGYMTKGIGEDLDRELNAAITLDDYQRVLADIQNALFHLHMLEEDANDKTPYTQVHTTDLKLLDYYKLQHAKVIMVSFIEEALRVYDNGKLVRSFLITAGRPELPPVPGLWAPMWRLVHTTFKSPYPKGSSYWYPDTPINYAIMYHGGGYFLHDSWWRNDYGPGTQFYHIDSSGNVSANYGTHGCVNMPTAQAAWLYNNTDYSTQILMY